MKSEHSLSRRKLLGSGLAWGVAGAAGGFSSAATAGSWKDWTGQLSADPAWRIHPRSLNELRRALSAGPAPVRPAGAGLSTAALCPTDGTLVDLDNLQGLVSWNDSLGRARVRGGTALATLGPLLAEVGQALPVMGDAAGATLGGAIATATHGSGIALTALSGRVTAAQLVTAEGDVIEVNERENSELIPAVACSLGALGVLTEIEIETVPAHRLREDIARVDLITTLQNLETIQRKNTHVELAVYPYSDTAILRRLNPSSEATTAPATLAGPRTRLLAAAARAGHNVPPLDGPLQAMMTALLPTGSAVGDSFRMLPVPAPLRYTAMEYALPMDQGIAALLELRDAVRRADLNVMLPLQLRFVSEDSAWLSPFYRQSSMAITVKQWRGADAEQLFALAEPIFRRHAGRPHWGFSHSLSAADLAGVYPRWADFQDVRRRLDPRGRLLSAPLARLFTA